MTGENEILKDAVLQTHCIIKDMIKRLKDIDLYFDRIVEKHINGEEGDEKTK